MQHNVFLISIVGEDDEHNRMPTEFCLASLISYFKTKHSFRL